MFIYDCRFWIDSNIDVDGDLVLQVLLSSTSQAVCPTKLKRFELMVCC